MRTWSWEEGHYDGPTGQVPQGCEVTWEEHVLPRGDQKTIKPETGVLPKWRVPPEEHDLYFRSGDHTFKLFTTKAPVDATLYTEELDLEPDATYRVTVPIFVDTFYYEDGKKNLPADPEWDCRLRVGFDNGEVAYWGPWIGDPELKLLEPIVLAIEIEALYPKMRLALQFQSRWGAHNSGYFLDDLKLEKVAETPEPPPPLEPPEGWSYPLVAARGSKLGVHGIYADDIREMAGAQQDAGAPFPIIKACVDLGWIDDIKGESPDTVTIGRLVWPGEGCQGVANWNATEMRLHAAQAIGRIMNKIASQLELASVDYWEPYNEPDPPGAEGYLALARLQIATMEVAEERGLKLALFSLNSGTPEWDEIEAMVSTGVFARARAGGHILALHEGTFNTYKAEEYWRFQQGTPIPGAPIVEGAGPLHFRYRYIYYLLEQRGEVVPLVVTEWYCGDEGGAPTDTIVEAMTWYDAEAAKDYYHWAFCPFTLGGGSDWEHTDFERFYPDAMEHMTIIKDRQNALPPEEPTPPEPPEEDCICPRVPYLRSYILLPQIADRNDAMLWRMCAAAATAEDLETVGHSADDAGVGPPDRYVTAVNPDEWGGSLEDFFEEHYPPALHYTAIEPQTPFECGVMLCPPLVDAVAIGQNDERWRDWDFGESPGGTVGEVGCYLTGLAIFFRRVGFDITPPVLDVILRLSQAAYQGDLMAGWGAMPDLFPSFFDNYLWDNARYGAESLQQLVDEGWDVILMRADAGHFVVFEERDGDDLVITNTWDGERETVPASWMGGVRALRRVGSEPPGPLPDLLWGIHDEGGGEWWARQ